MISCQPTPQPPTPPPVYGATLLTLVALHLSIPKQCSSYLQVTGRNTRRVDSEGSGVPAHGLPARCTTLDVLPPPPCWCCEPAYCRHVARPLSLARRQSNHANPDSLCFCIRPTSPLTPTNARANIPPCTADHIRNCACLFGRQAAARGHVPLSFQKCLICVHL